jgi:hypothetical protein
VAGSWWSQKWVILRKMAFLNYNCWKMQKVTKLG